VENDSVWVKYTLTYLDFQTAGTSKTVTVHGLSAGGWLEDMAANVTTLFTGPGIVSVTAQPKLDTSNIGAGFLVNTGTAGFAAGDQGYTTKSAIPNGANLGPASFTAAKNITLTLTSSGANLSALTAGSIDVWVNVSTLP